MAFCKQELHVLTQENLDWFNPGLNLTIFEETGPRKF